MGRSRTRSACTKRTTGSSGSTSTCRAGASEVRRSRRLVVSFIATVGNYEYGFFWYFYLDGNIQLEVKLTGIVSPMAIEPGTQPEFANVIARGRRRAAPPAHLQRAARLRRRRRGERGLRGRRRARAARPRQPVAATRSASERRGSRPSRRRSATSTRRTSRTWRIANPNVRNGLGQPTAYKLVPTMSTPTLLAHPDSPIGKRAGVRAAQPLGHAVRARRAARRGRVPEPARGRRRPARAGPRRTASIADTDVVVWYTFGVTHFVRPEDWPVMPVEYTGFPLTPFGFFDRNPALDVPRDRRALPHD